MHTLKNVNSRNRPQNTRRSLKRDQTMNDLSIISKNIINTLISRQLQNLIVIIAQRSTLFTRTKSFSDFLEKKR